MLFVKLLLIAALLGCINASVSSDVTSKLIFHETFDTDPFSGGRWVKSKADKYIDQPVQVKPPANAAEGFESDNGVMLSQGMKFYAFGAKFDKVWNPRGKDLVIQYELKLDETLVCGGAYIKLPRVGADGSAIDFSTLNTDTPYSLMFGPDKCGATNNKVHFIMNHQNPRSKIFEERHFNSSPTIRSDKKYHLYTVHVKQDNTVDLYIDKKNSKSGSLLTTMNPPINPPEEVDDPNDSKPAAWVDEARIVDPNAVKPADWDEQAPKMIPDLDAVKPKNWLDDAPEKVLDPSAKKPADWEDEEDGEWIAPTIPNPDCIKNGCGPWSRPLKKNPDYKGPWKAKKIDNPAYKGKWAPRKIKNVNFFVDNDPVQSIAPMSGVAVEVWTTNSGIFFDNFVVATSLDDAWAFAAETFDKKAEAEARKTNKVNKEKKEKDRAKKEANKAAKRTRGKKTNKRSSKIEVSKLLSIDSLKSLLRDFSWQEFKENVAINPYPLITVVLGLLLIIVLMTPRRVKVVHVPVPVPAPVQETKEAEETAKVSSRRSAKK